MSHLIDDSIVEGISCNCGSSILLCDWEGVWLVNWGITGTLGNSLGKG